MLTKLSSVYKYSIPYKISEIYVDFFVKDIPGSFTFKDDYSNVINGYVGVLPKPNQRNPLLPLVLYSN